MNNEQFRSLADDELAQVKGGAGINLGSFGDPFTSWSQTTIAGPLVTGILGGVSNLLNGIFGSLGLGGLLKFT